MEKSKGLKIPSIMGSKLLFVGVVVLGLGVMYKTKGFGLLKGKGQKEVDPLTQDNTTFEVTPTGEVVTTQANLLTENEATNIAISFRDTMAEAWGGLGTGWFGWSPSVEEYNDATKKLINLSNAQLAQVVNAFAKKYKADTFNTVRKVLAEVSVTTQSCITNKAALLAKLNQINA